MVERIKPNASVAFSDGIDGRDSHYYIDYRCPKCNRYIKAEQQACDKCGTFFDWTKTARIKVERSIVWN